MISIDWSRKSFDARREEPTEEGEGDGICGVGERRLQENRIGRRIEEKTRIQSFKREVNKCSIGHRVHEVRVGNKHGGVRSIPLAFA
jgi:hypothetical protein